MASHKWEELEAGWAFSGPSFGNAQNGMQATARFLLLEVPWEATGINVYCI